MEKTVKKKKLKTKKAVKKETPATAHKYKYNPNKIFMSLGILIFIAILITIFYFDKISTDKQIINEDNEVAVVINGENVYKSEVEDWYNILPPDFKSKITKEIFLDQVIEKVLLVQDAKAKHISVPDEEAKRYVEDILSKSGYTEEMLEAQLMEKGITLEKLYKMYKEQLLALKLLNQTIIQGIEVSDAEIKEFYETNKDKLSNSKSIDESKEQIETILKMNKQGEAIKKYIEELKENAEINILKN